MKKPRGGKVRPPPFAWFPFIRARIGGYCCEGWFREGKRAVFCSKTGGFCTLLRLFLRNFRSLLNAFASSLASSFSGGSLARRCFIAMSSFLLWVFCFSLCLCVYLHIRCQRREESFLQIPVPAAVSYFRFTVFCEIVRRLFFVVLPCFFICALSYFHLLFF